MLASANLHDWFEPINLILFCLIRSGDLFADFLAGSNCKKNFTISAFASISTKNPAQFIRIFLYRNDSPWSNQHLLSAIQFGNTKIRDTFPFKALEKKKISSQHLPPEVSLQDYCSLFKQSPLCSQKQFPNLVIRLQNKFSSFGTAGVLS